MSLLILIVGVLLFVGLVIIHELGHFIVAQRNGVVAEEFGIFFPPSLYKRQTKKGWIFSLNLLPLGGFVKLKGEHDTDTGQGTFGAASVWAKSKIMAAGVLMNLLAGVVLLIILAWIGLPQIIPNQYNVSTKNVSTTQQVIIYDVLAGSPAQKIGLKPDNQIIGIGLPGHVHQVTGLNQLVNLTSSYAGKKTVIEYLNNGNQQSKTVRLLSKSVVTASLKTNHPKGYLGVAIEGLNLKSYGLLSGPLEAIGLTWQIIRLTFIGLGHALAGLGSIIAGFVTNNTVARVHGQTQAVKQVAGPVGIFVILKDGSLLGYQYMLFIIAVISLTLAIMNILPIPVLDGGRLWLMLITRAIGKPLRARTEEMVSAIGMVILLILIILITISDIHRFL